MFRINEVHAVVATDENDDEGVVAVRTVMGWMPLVSADPARLEQILEIAQNMATARGQTYTVKKFTGVEVVRSIEPAPQPPSPEDN